MGAIDVLRKVVQVMSVKVVVCNVRVDLGCSFRGLVARLHVVMVCPLACDKERVRLSLVRRAGRLFLRRDARAGTETPQGFCGGHGRACSCSGQGRGGRLRTRR